MGIHDREYVRIGPRSPQGLGRLRFLSFNTWLIIINVAVFVLDALLFASGVMVNVRMGDVYAADATREQIAHSAIVTPDGGGPPLIIDTRGDQLPGRPQSVVAAPGAPVLFIDGKPYAVIGARRITPMPPLSAALHFSTAKFFQLEVWRLVGFQFLHGGTSHLLMNMLGLFFFGGLVEGYLGPKRYAAFYLVCGIFGALTYLLLNLIGNVVPAGWTIPGLLFNDVHTPLVGASAGVFGVLMAGAFLEPQARVYFFFFPMRLATLAYLVTGIAFFVVLTGGSNAGGQAAHIGGALAGYYFIRHTHLLRDFFDIFGPSRRKPGEPRRSLFSRPAPSEEELDRIFRKVREHGLHSLTEAERQALRRTTEEANQRGSRS